MKEMVYSWRPGFDILDSGVHAKVPYWIVSYGTHPCAYLEITDFPQLDYVDCHGGITYTEDHLRGVYDQNTEGFKPNTRKFIGWDYGHIPDFCGELCKPPMICEALFNSDSIFTKMTLENAKKHKWTTEEILNEVKIVIEQSLGIYKGEPVEFYW